MNEGIEKNNSELLAEEIKHILDRNQNEDFLRKLLTRAIILEKLLKDRQNTERRATV